MIQAITSEIQTLITTLLIYALSAELIEHVLIAYWSSTLDKQARR